MCPLLFFFSLQLRQCRWESFGLSLLKSSISLWLTLSVSLLCLPLVCHWLSLLSLQHIRVWNLELGMTNRFELMRHSLISEWTPSAGFLCVPCPGAASRRLGTGLGGCTTQKWQSEHHSQKRMACFWTVPLEISLWPTDAYYSFQLPWTCRRGRKTVEALECRLDTDPQACYTVFALQHWVRICMVFSQGAGFYSI